MPCNQSDGVVGGTDKQREEAASETEFDIFKPIYFIGNQRQKTQISRNGNVMHMDPDYQPG